MDCIKSGHGRSFEYVNVEMIIDDYSSRVMREYYTHIAGAPTRLQSSTRYIDYANKGFDFVVPHKIRANSEALSLYCGVMDYINEQCAILENDYNIPKEDVANLLPLGMTTKIVDKRNLRSLVKMSHVRKCSRAYWEFQELFYDIENELSKISDEWKWIVDNLFVPKCEFYGKCTENNSCGRKVRD